MFSFRKLFYIISRLRMNILERAALKIGLSQVMHLSYPGSNWLYPKIVLPANVFISRNI